MEEAILDAIRRAEDIGLTVERVRRSGLSRRAIQYKCDGDGRATQWDVWAIERALQLHAGESERERHLTSSSGFGPSSNHHR